MKGPLLTFIFLGLFAQITHAQTISDLKDLEKLKDQLEKSRELPTELVEKTTDAKTLEVFNEELSTPEIGMPATDPEKRTVEKIDEPVDAGKEPSLFGFDVFENATVDFAPDVYGPVDEEYPLGPGDELVITVWGEVELRHELVINRQGQIYIPDVGLIKAVGLNMAQLRQRLTSLMGKSYSSISKNKAFLDVSLGKLRSIRVFVVGDVNSPGVFTVPALSSVFNMLFYAGGVKESASLRNISVVRSDKVVNKLDFYDFLTKGAKFSNVRLQNHDVLLIPSAKKRVHLRGAVIKPAIFELKENDGLTDLIELAGGFSERAYIDNIQIERFVENRDQKLVNINYKQLKSEGTDFPLQNGDRVIVSNLNRELDNFVTITGPVFGPKRFEYRLGMTITDLFNEVDSISGEAYLERVHITRTLPDRKRQIFSINLQDFLENDGQDLLLAPEDLIELKSKSVLFPPDSVTIYGAVNNSGRFQLKKDMTLKDLIFAAGGFRKDALIKEAEISRINPKQVSEKNLASILYVKIDSNYTKHLQPQMGELFFLEPYDNIFIRANSDWELQRNVTVAGEVQLPGIYTLHSKTERITDIIKRAGGLKTTAYLDGATLIRSYNDVGKIGVDFNKIFKEPSDDENIFLQAGDRISVPERLATVKVAGGVNFPSSVLYEQGKSLNYYIKAAGGFSEMADQKNVTIRLANGRPLNHSSFLFWKYLPGDITAGSSIIVPVLAEKESIDWSGAIRDAAAILSSVATTILILERIK